MACLVLQVGTGAFARADEGDPSVPIEDPVLVGAGGIASCDSPGDELTAELIEALPHATVFTAGDNAYQDGSASQFNNCYDKTWGRFKGRTHPAVGNHDNKTSGASPYYDYFGAAAGTKGQGWYSYDLGGWHIVVLNSNCSSNGKCAKGSAQEQWLKADLARSTARCTAAVIHHPLFSSDSIDGNRPEVRPLWDALYAAGADLVVSGHARVYERFAPQTHSGDADAAFGLPLLNVGTGGRGHASFKTPVANSVVRDRTSWGVLKLTLHAESFDFAFLPVPGGTFADTGSRGCHGAPGGTPAPPDGGEDPPDGGEDPPDGGDIALTFSPMGDASVVKGSPSRNYGQNSTLLTDASPVTGAFLRFSVSGVEGTVTRARLRLYVTNGSGNGPSVYPTAPGLNGGADAPWPQAAITWSNRPARTGPPLDDLGKVSAGLFVELDVTGAVTGDGDYSFELGSSASDGTDFASSESSTTSRRPQLIVDVAPPAPPEVPAPQT